MTKSKTKAEKRKLAEVVFPTGVVAEMPPYDEIKAKYSYTCCDKHPATRFIERLFFTGGKIEFEAKPGVDREAVLLKFQRWIRSFEPKHEHKIAACAWLLDTNFEVPEVSEGV